MISPNYASYLDFFAASAMSRFRHESRLGGRLPVRLLKVRQDAHEDEDPAVDELLVGLVLGGASKARWRWGGGAWNQTAARLPGDIGVSPHRATGLFQVDGPSQMLVIGLPVARLAEAFGSDVPLDFGRLHDRYAHSPTATRLALGMWRAAGLPGAVSDDAIEAAALALIEGLRALSGIPEKSAAAPALSSRDIAIVDARISALGAEHASVKDMADALAMPVKRFRTAFRRALGRRPHAYLLERRIRRGMSWLEDPTRGIAEIALELGFANQPHFTAAFTQQLGLSPLKYRRLLVE